MICSVTSMSSVVSVLLLRSSALNFQRFGCRRLRRRQPSREHAER